MPGVLRILVAMGALIVGCAAIGPLADAAAATSSATATNLVGRFGISPGQCAVSGAPSGSYMEIEVDGTAIPNAGSGCADEAGIFTPITQGGQGLVTGAYEPDPVPTFDASGNSDASTIIRPVRFLANTLGLSTTCANQANDPTSTGDCVLGTTGFPASSLEAVAPGQPGCPATSTTQCLFGDLSGLGVTWAGYPIKSTPSNPLSFLSSLLAKAGATCVNSSGCANAGVIANPSSKATCVSDADPSDCALFGNFNPATGAYTLAISTGVGLGLFPNAALQLVLRGTFTALSSGSLPDSSSAAGEPGQGGSSSGVTSSGGTSGGSSTAGSASLSSSAGSSGAALKDGQLQGTFTLGPSSCLNSTPTGSYFIISFNPVTEGNSSSSCDGGSYTLLQPGTSALGIGTFTPNPSPTFDANGNSLANSIITPVLFNGHALGLGTSAEDVQDAPGGQAVFTPPEAVIDGTNLAVDLRSLNATYDGPPNDTCAQSYGVGCWLEGSRVATGTYDPTTGDFTLDWYSSQDFSGGSGEVDFHLSGHFSGTVVPADPSVVADLAQSTYAVTSTSTESDSFAPAVSPSMASPSTSTSSVPPTTLPVKETYRVHTPRVDVALKSRPGVQSVSSRLPLLMVVVGIMVAMMLLWAGRRSRKRFSESSEEST
jgi:hypothetical protein